MVAEREMPARQWTMTWQLDNLALSGDFPYQDGTCVPCSGRRILNHWTTREVSSWISDLQNYEAVSVCCVQVLRQEQMTNGDLQRKYCFA